VRKALTLGVGVGGVGKQAGEGQEKGEVGPERGSSSIKLE
jgi:hypothetical protein